MNNPKKTLSIIGCGHVGKTLARLWSQAGTFHIGEVVNRSEQSARSAVAMIGAGEVVASVEKMGPADVFLIGTPDNHIVEACNTLVKSGVLAEGNVVFHCSGALPSSDLASAAGCGAVIASVHPVKSFADPDISVTSFSGTFCGVEGDEQALAVLQAAFENIGAETFRLEPRHKTLYHAASVIVCNYLSALMEFGLQCYGKSGLDRETAQRVMQPIVRGTIENIFTLGTVDALTGPIARGDHQVVSRQLEAITDWEPQLGELYRDLGRVALHLSRQQGTASPRSLETLAKLLE